MSVGVPAGGEMTTILHKYTDYMAIAEIGGGGMISLPELKNQNS